MSDEIELEGETGAPIWAAFGDLMSVLLGMGAGRPGEGRLRGCGEMEMA